MSAVFLMIIMVFLSDNIAPHAFERRSHPEDREMFIRADDDIMMNDYQPEPRKIGRGPSKAMPVYNFLIISAMLTGFGLGLRYAEKLVRKDKQRKEVEKELLKSELLFLKSQISPHFFLNTLNNIYSLLQTDTEDGRKSILQLSKMMRYLLYESENSKTMLSQEISFLKNYIELMKIRISPKVHLSFSFPENYKDFEFPPLLFVPFIENSFKHGVSYREPSFIKMELSVNNNEVLFICNNSISSKSYHETDIYGIGIENVKRRLLLLFPGKYELKISKEEASFHVYLKINLIS